MQCNAETPSSYLKQLEADSKTLATQREWASSAQPDALASADEPPSGASPAGEPGDSDVSNPLFDNISLGHTNPQSVEPVFLGEAACLAFGDRLLHCVDKNYTPISSTSLSYFQHPTFNRMLSRDYNLPDRIEAKLLIQIAYKFVGNDQHLYLRKTFMRELDDIYQEEARPSTIWLCKLFGLLALGEFYSHRKKTIDNYGVPGTDYYLRAINLLQDIYEDATVTQVETLILLSCFANGLGRVKAAYTYSGIAMRLALTLGLHRSVPASSAISPVERENRRRIWWTLYHFDRVAASKLGYPVTIRDEDIDVEMPSMTGLAPTEREEFADPSHLVAKVNLAKITGNICTFQLSGIVLLHADLIVNEIYCLPARSQGTFVQRVHSILKQLRGWNHDLPDDIRVYTERSPRHVASLHLAYNQLIITTTRPIMLHIFKTQFQLGARVNTPTPAQIFSSTTLALAEACVSAARGSSSILTRLFIDGSIATFGYLDAHHLFSSTPILIMSTVMNPSVATSEAVQTSLNVLKAMRDHGNIPAGDYCERLAQIQSSVSRMRAEAEKQQYNDALSATIGDVTSTTLRTIDSQRRVVPHDATRLPDSLLDAPTPIHQFPYTDYNVAYGSMDALANPLIEDFLGGTWLAWSSGASAENDPLRAVALELEDHQLFGS